MVRIENMDEATARIEAALYSAGRPLRIEDIIRASGTESRTKTLDLLGTIMKKTKTAFKALEITTLPDGSYVMQLKPEYQFNSQKICIKTSVTKCNVKDIIIYCIHATNSIKTTCGDKRFRSLCTSKRIATIRLHHSSKCR